MLDFECVCALIHSHTPTTVWGLMSPSWMQIYPCNNHPCKNHVLSTFLLAWSASSFAAYDGAFLSAMPIAVEQRWGDVISERRPQSLGRLLWATGGATMIGDVALPMVDTSARAVYYV
eukprot:103781-Pyramimonas_sp.AAC.1